MQQQRKKQCSMCHGSFPHSGFYQNKHHKDGLDSRCKKCHDAYIKKNRTSEMVRKQYLRREYGLTLKQYGHMLAEQHGVCAICKKSEKVINVTGYIQPLSVDHDHKTGDVRALLCQACNQALGLMDEDPERIRALLRYAEWCQTREQNKKIIQLLMIEMERSNGDA